MAPNHNHIIDFSANTVSVPMTVYTTEDSCVLTRATVENLQPSSQPSAATSSYAISTPRAYSFCMSVNTIEDESVLTISIVDNPKPYSHPVDTTP